MNNVVPPSDSVAPVTQPHASCADNHIAYHVLYKINYYGIYRGPDGAKWCTALIHTWNAK